MVKILSQAGITLADVYNVEGSVAGIEQLETRELTIVHEMGGTIFSERLTGAIRRITTGALTQNTDFNVVITDLPDGIWRVLNVLVIASATTRVSRAQLSIRDALDGREVPMLVWDVANDLESIVEIVENGGATGSQFALIPATGWQTPTMGVGIGQRATVNELALRGRTSSFGAGNVTVIALIYIAHSHVGGISSRGLPIPGW